jgi:hypothetical protein
MESSNGIAFKEWSVICAALAAGQQSVILRKGGIHEGREGFRVAHREFWLFPTEFHQASDILKPQAQPFIDEIKREPTDPEKISIHLYAVVENVVHVKDESILQPLDAWHLWSEQTIQQRFHYKNPGLFALMVRIFQLPCSVTMDSAPHFAGCRSWVELPQPISTGSLRPVLTDQEHDARMVRLTRIVQRPE